MQAFQVQDACHDGVLDAAHTVTAYWYGKDKAASLFGTGPVFGANASQILAWIHYGGGKDMYRELIQDKLGLNVVGFFAMPMPTQPLGWFKERITDASQLQGLKYRTVGLATDIMQGMGLSVTQLPGGEIVPALERGVIDGTDWGTLGMNEDLGFHKIAKYPIYPGIHSMPVGDVAINLDKWNALPDDLKVMFEMAVRDFGRDMIQTMALEDIRAEGLAKKEGVTLVNWTPEERKKLRTVAQGVWKEYGEKNELAKRIYESQVAWLKELGLLD